MAEDIMADRAHVEEFNSAVCDPLAKRLVSTFIDCHRDVSLNSTDVVTRLREMMEQELHEGTDAASQSDHR
ncbi:MAG: hypothetical protein ACRYG8_19315 [Janthinobacterium lividum]